MKPYLKITELSGIPVPKLPMEIVERKGKGHPDYICDKASEELGIALSNYYLERYGRILHYNVDKCVLAGGQSRANFGDGEVIEPIYLLLVGRAVDVREGTERQRVPIGKFALRATKKWLKEDIPHLDTNHDIIVDYKIRAGSTDLVGNFEGDLDIPRANDTSFGVGYAPFSDLENLVYKTETLLNSGEVKKKLPGIGEDIKVMGVRQQDKMTLTIAAAMVCTEIQDKDHYYSIQNDMKDLILDQSTKISDKTVEVFINTADDRTREIFYLTVTGTSAEQGDDGQVGRGNRPNGLITPFRPMTLEAAAGKNPVSHVGKTYSIASSLIVKRIVEECDTVDHCNCYIVSQIGKPITDPLALNVQVYPEAAIKTNSGDIQSITEEIMADMPKLWRGIINREYELF